MASCSEQQGQTTIPMTAAMQRKVMSENLKDVRHKLFVMSGKGGVGKSSVTVNLAAALAAQGFNVGILDVDLHGPSVPHLLGSHGFVRVDNEDGKLVPVSCGERLALISIESFLEDKDAAIIWRGPKKVGAIQQFVADVKWGALDYLLIDSPPGTGDEHMTILDAIPDAKCVVVTTPQEISLADVRKALDFLKVVKADVLGLVENMSGLFCPHCGEEIDLFKKGGGEALAKQEGLNFLGAIPLDLATVVAADRGPHSSSSPKPCGKRRKPNSAVKWNIFPKISSGGRPNASLVSSPPTAGEDGAFLQKPPLAVIENSPSTSDGEFFCATDKKYH